MKRVSVRIVAALVVVTTSLGTSAALAGVPETLVAPLEPPPALAPPIELREVDVLRTSTSGRHSLGAYLHRELVPVQGGRRLLGRDVYLALGRPDLADAYDWRQRVALAAFGGGLLACFAGLGLTTFGPKRYEEPLAVAGATSFAVGIGTIATVLLVGVDPLSKRERAEAIDAYNAHRPPATPAEPSNDRPAPPKSQWGLPRATAVEGGGGEILWGGTFD